MRRFAAVLLAAGIVLGWASSAQAHPLGNFSVNHYHGLRLHPDRLDDLAVLDEAEIPTRQAMSAVDVDGDDTVSDAERATFAATTCRDLMAGLHATVDGRPVTWILQRSDLTLHPGAANLPTSRTECRLSAAVDLSRPVTVEVVDSYRANRVGWHEMTAAAEGIGLVHPSVPAASTSDELRSYPQDLLASPLDQRSVTLRTGAVAGAANAPPDATSVVPGPVGRWLKAMTDRFYRIAGDGRLGLAVGLLGVALALLLGAAHAALPGHGKTVMAAYLAGRRGTARDAVTVGATVTVTHTAGVLVLGLLLTVVSGLVGELALGWLGVTSGLLVMAIGVGLLRSALRRRAERRRLAVREVDRMTVVRVPAAAVATMDRVAADMPLVRPVGPAQRTPGHDGVLPLTDFLHTGLGDRRTDDDDVRARLGANLRGLSRYYHDHAIGHRQPPGSDIHGSPIYGGRFPSTRADHRHEPGGHHHHGHHDHGPHDLGHHDHGHHDDGHYDHGHRDHGHHEHGHHDHGHHDDGHRDHGRRGPGHHDHGRHHGPAGGHHHDHGDGPGAHHHRLGRGGLVGLGIAGGLVPSPSALIVLLGAIALGHTWFGVLLVLAYGVGMAATLTAAGLALVLLRQRLHGVAWRRFTRWPARLSAAMPALTAALVLLVGIGLALRSLIPLLA